MADKPLDTTVKEPLQAPFVIQRTPREISNANLITFKPGQSGNTLGRPKKEATITSLVKDILEDKDPKTGKTNARLIAEAMVRQAIKDPRVLQEVLNRVEGKVTDTIDMRTEAVSILYQLVKPHPDESGRLNRD